MTALTDALNPNDGFDNMRESRGMDMGKLKEEGTPIASSITQADKNRLPGRDRMHEIQRRKAMAVRPDLMVTKKGFSPDAATKYAQGLAQVESAANKAMAGADAFNQMNLADKTWRDNINALQDQEVFGVLDPYMQARQGYNDQLMNAILGDQVRAAGALNDIQAQQYQNMLGLQNSLNSILTGGLSGLGGVGNLMDMSMGGLGGGMGGGLGGFDPMGGDSWIKGW